MLNIQVSIDLIGAQDFIDGISDHEFSFGSLLYLERDAPQVVSRVFSGAPVNLKGGGIQTDVSLYGPGAFIVKSDILETGI